MNPCNRTLLTGVVLLLTGSPIAFAGTIEAINHTKWAINHFSVNGQSGLDAIGPFQGGGGGCCYHAPPLWKPGITVKVDWETGVGSSEGFPGFQDREKYLAWVKKLETQKKTAFTHDSPPALYVHRKNLRHHRAFPALRSGKSDDQLRRLRQSGLSG